MRVRRWQECDNAFRYEVEGQGWVEIQPDPAGYFRVKWMRGGRIYFEMNRLFPWHERELPLFRFVSAIHRARKVLKLEFRVKEREIWKSAQENLLTQSLA